MMKRNVLVISLMLLLIPTSFVHSQSSRSPGVISFEFLNQNIRDILYSLSSYVKIPIVADDTVTGTASFQFVGSDFTMAFDTFLVTNRLYVEKTPELWTVSRIRLHIDENNLITFDGLDVSPSQILEKLSFSTKTTIVQDILPSVKLSLHITDATLQEAAELVMKSFSDYQVFSNEKFIQVKRIASQPASAISSPTGNVRIRENGGIYEISGEKVKLSEVLESFFNIGRKEFSSFVRGDQIIERIRFSGKSFQESLSLILEQSGAEYAEINNVWYIFPIQQAEIIKNLRNDGKSWKRFDLKYIPMETFLPLLQTRFPTLVTIAIPDGKGFLSHVNDETVIEINNYLQSIDTGAQTIPIRLKYIKTEDLLKALPPSVTRNDIIDTGNGNTFFFRGTMENRALFLADLEIIDRPRTRIRYDLLIVQFQDSSNLKWGTNVDARQLQPGDTSMVTGSLGSLLNLNFDVVTVFGYQFAAKMNVALSENQANVFADTTLYGLSGQEIKFQNTSTYRYRDSNVDPDTGKPVYTGITREIISGLLLNINGWVSGDGMITTTVTASVSKRGADVSSSVGNPPPTSEKVITTQVRSRSGETVVLSGLRQNDSTIVEERLPFLSRIPVLGWLFRNRNSSTENTQMIIYLVPHIDLGSDEYTDAGLKTASIYNRLVAPFIGKEE